MTGPALPSPERIAAVLRFLDETNRLKDTLRSGRTPEGRQESTAEHSWRLCLLVILFGDALEDVDLMRLIKICIVHDLGEAISGDVPAIDQRAGDDRAARERADLVTLCAPLPGDLRAEIVGLWDEYAEARTPEAVLAKGFDKIETMLTHSTGKNPDDFDYRFNLNYGLPATNRHPLLAAIRAQVDDRTRRLDRGWTGPGDR
ncbi:HD domain-containing protein [Hoeflea ulvae]|uniref:5'-deoxynucleotidase n=1 Tax=Hoeflea ulvae TaxID=2983764 RepID=A0ABT3YET2_9HYPH|nr:HD domain-containing protein [Hoeflea ulvae]MCY0094384.1 HD domain-containing protein [Hoeflea ulvae]